jgi:hypothetical protein
LFVRETEVSEQQILDALDRLFPMGRREAVRRLIAGASTLDRVIDTVQPHLVVQQAGPRYTQPKR